MSRIFYDFEFIEGFLPNRIAGLPLPNWLSKRRHAIDMISIAMVDDGGKKYSAISSEYNYEDASQWVRDNVIEPLYYNTVFGDNRNHCTPQNFHKRYGKSLRLIRNEVFQFICPYSEASKYAGVGSIDNGAKAYLKENPPTLIGYYSAYDHVLFCSLFGIMDDLPKGFPMYTVDLKQMLDERIQGIFADLSNAGMLSKATSFDQKLAYIESHPSYPAVKNEHLAESDVLFNKDLYNFLSGY